MPEGAAAGDNGSEENTGEAVAGLEALLREADAAAAEARAVAQAAERETGALQAALAQADAQVWRRSLRATRSLSPFCTRWGRFVTLGVVFQDAWMSSCLMGAHMGSGCTPQVSELERKAADSARVLREMGTRERELESALAQQGALQGSSDDELRAQAAAVRQADTISNTPFDLTLPLYPTMSTRHDLLGPRSSGHRHTPPAIAPKQHTHTTHSGQAPLLSPASWLCSPGSVQFVQCSLL